MAVDADEARRQARQVLEDDRYHARDVPRPFRGVLEWVGARMEDVGRPVAEALSTTPGIIATLTVVAALAAVVATNVARRRTRRAEEHTTRRRRARGIDPRALEAEADAAEEAGDLDGAVRLRFRAGVVRLEDAGAVARRADATTARLTAQVPGTAFAGLARTFDEVAYGGRPATPADVASARRTWPEVVAGAREGAR